MLLNPKSKLLWHGDRVERWLKGTNPSPILVEIAPTALCNASCPWCFFRDKHSTVSIDRDIMLQTITKLSSMDVKAINWTGGGESVLHPDFNEFVNAAHALGLEQGLFTNAYLEIENAKMFKWIRISLTDREFEPIKRPEGYFGICVNMLISTTERKLREWCKEARNMGAKYFQVRPALVGNYVDQSLISPPWYLEKYGNDNFKIILTLYKFEEAVIPHKYDRCYGYHFCPSIDWNGKVGVCLYRMEEEKYILGDLKEKTFTEIWQQKNCSEDLIDDKCQNCCKNHEINKMLFEAKQLKHVNFL